MMIDFSDVLLTVDFDRTFSARDSSVPQRNLDAVRYFMDHGGTFTINTGRSAVNFAQQIKTTPVNAPILLYNGSAAYENGQLCQCVEIDVDMWDMVELLHEKFPEMDLEIHGGEYHYLIEPTEKVLALYENLDWKWKAAKRGDVVGPFIKLAIFGQTEVPLFSELYKATEEELARFDEATRIIETLYGDKVEVFRAAPRILNIHAKGVSKLKAARTLQERLEKKILICVGDAQNDVPMLDGADYAFCPADASIADRYPNVCCCDEGAIADVIYNEIPKILASR
ncbi:MAG: HAD-IIB family hydrolase [Oscillospiraceae bacterium]|nr:HAD-IIB family hydrolase [Oscillospiraceae bacterium]